MHWIPDVSVRTAGVGFCGSYSFFLYNDLPAQNNRLSRLKPESRTFTLQTKYTCRAHFYITLVTTLNHAEFLEVALACSEEVIGYSQTQGLFELASQVLLFFIDQIKSEIEVQSTPYFCG